MIHRKIISLAYQYAQGSDATGKTYENHITSYRSYVQIPCTRHMLVTWKGGLENITSTSPKRVNLIRYQHRLKEYSDNIEGIAYLCVVVKAICSWTQWHSCAFFCRCFLEVVTFRMSSLGLTLFSSVYKTPPTTQNRAVSADTRGGQNYRDKRHR